MENKIKDQYKTNSKNDRHKATKSIIILNVNRPGTLIKRQRLPLSPVFLSGPHAQEGHGFESWSKPVPVAGLIPGTSECKLMKWNTLKTININEAKTGSFQRSINLINVLLN